MTNEFWNWWQHLPERLDPVIIEIGFFKLQYYGLMYLVAFGLTYALVLYRIRREDGFTLTSAQVEALTTAMIVGVILGGRLGYVLFYNIGYYLRHPLEIFLPFSFGEGIQFTGISGMSYHGGLIGVIIAAVVYGRRNGVAFLEIADLYGPAVPLGYTFGRIGNFINGELYGRVTDLPVGMVFPMAPTPERRHPSQLYEALLEGILCFIVLWLPRKRIRTRGAMLSLYLVSYGAARFFVEFFRQPDAHLGFVMFRFTAGQLLCALMILSGVLSYVYLKKTGAPPVHEIGA
ncbi:prolipoprotein diacylglyceryl transferase [Desulfococcus sp.]|uniref:prolipoprotein diacylglyceryl transferase n=1 Tax=Desulfococcus sp. TaxID=2025834 RepID=UPI0035948379